MNYIRLLINISDTYLVCTDRRHILRESELALGNPKIKDANFMSL